MRRPWAHRMASDSRNRCHRDGGAGQGGVHTATAASSPRGVRLTITRPCAMRGAASRRNMASVAANRRRGSGNSHRCNGSSARHSANSRARGVCSSAAASVIGPRSRVSAGGVRRVVMGSIVRGRAEMESWRTGLAGAELKSSSQRTRCPGPAGDGKFRWQSCCFCTARSCGGAREVLIMTTLTTGGRTHTGPPASLRAQVSGRVPGAYFPFPFVVEQLTCLTRSPSWAPPAP